MSDKTRLRYASMAELLYRAKVDYKGKKPKDVYKRLSSMRQKADDAKKERNEEYQYIFLRRWMNSIEWLKKSAEYQNLLITCENHFNQVKEVQKALQDLNKSLETRYKQGSKGKMLEAGRITEQMELKLDNEIGIESCLSNMDCPINLPETPTKDPLAADNEDLITCDRLFQILQTNNRRYLIIDIRSKLEFESSHIVSDRCINIPEKKITTGVSTSYYEKYLFQKNKRFHELFKFRGSQYVDELVLLDLNSTSKALSPNNDLNKLRKVLLEWDLGVKHEKISILDGGYREWMMRYPSLTTNPKVIEPTLTNDVFEILDDIDYPEWIDEENMKSRDTKQSTLKTTSKNNSIMKTDMTTNKMRFKDTKFEIDKNTSFKQPDNFSSMPEPMDIDQVPVNTITNSQTYDEELLIPQQKRTSSIMKQNDIPTKPIVDRSNKPVSLKSSSESKELLNLMRQLNELAKTKERLVGEIFEQERSLHEGSSDDEIILSNLQSLFAKLEDTKKEYENVEEQINNLIKDPKQLSTMENTEQTNLEFKLNLVKRRIKNLSAERKKLHEKPKPNDYKESPAAEIKNDTHKEPLKSATSPIIGGGLERSYSSPNLLQLVSRRVPQIDRSSKPQVPSYNQNANASNDSVKIQHHSWANREERMTPVHGSVHPGITGLKNLGNSCYMNSIIQCLSNTTQLAKYFTNNLYADDLNTNNDSTTQGQVVEEVAQVIKALWRGQYKSISPHDLKIAVGQYKLQFESYEQQDSHEFLTFLLDWMHNDLKKECKTPLGMTVAEKAWDKAMTSQRSIISDLFFGQLRSTITCSSCKQSSTTYETFNSLTTSLPQTNRCTLNDCIQKFVTGQKVVGWKCPKCQAPREATKKFDFVKLAPIIVIHLNRFAESCGWLEKRNAAVDFPLTGFNLKPYVVTDSNTPTNIRSYSYSLYAMSNHYGTMEGGHYTAFCKNAAQDKWYKYDDQTVTEVTTSQVKSQNTSAYLLFYTSFSTNIV